MIRLEAEKVIIEIPVPEHFEYDFIEDLHLDLIYLLNCVHLLQNHQEHHIPTDLDSILRLQKALFFSIVQMRQLYPIKY